MTDPAERLRQFITEQKARQQRIDAARLAWRDQVPQLAETARGLVALLREAGVGDVRVETLPDEITVAFGERPIVVESGGGLAELVPLPRERGAQASFTFDGDEGKVVGVRAPFFPGEDSPVFEHFADLGDPAVLGPAIFGHAVAAFLEWATAGPGRGSGRVRFQ